MKTSVESPYALRPNHGILGFVLGLAGIFLLQFLGPVAWILGRRNLNQRRVGVMDRNGESLTQAGMLLGMIGTLLLLLQVLVFGFFWYMFARAFSGFNIISLIQQMAVN